MAPWQSYRNRSPVGKKGKGRTRKNASNGGEKAAMLNLRVDFHSWVGILRIRASHKSIPKWEGRAISPPDERSRAEAVLFVLQS